MEAGILQAEGEGEVVVHAALELSRSGWLLAVQGPSDGRPSHHKIAAGDAKRVLHLMAQARCATARRSGHDHVRVSSCYEAGYEGFWLHRVLVAAGVESFVVDPARCGSIGAPSGARPIGSTSRPSCALSSPGAMARATSARWWSCRRPLPRMSAGSAASAGAWSRSAPRTSTASRAC